MKTYIIFDCYQTLIYKKNLEKIVKKFIVNELSVNIALKKIEHALELIYYRHKFNHPKFASAKSRELFYISYNKELLNIIGFEISNKQALSLHKYLKKSYYQIFPDVIATLKFLKQKGYRLVIIANWTAGLDKIMNDLDLSKYFYIIHSSHDAKIEKPNPKIFTQLLKKIDPQHNTVYYIGDDYQLDIIPARSAGLTPILIDRKNKYSKKNDCIKIKNFKELQKIITKEYGKVNKNKD